MNLNEWAALVAIIDFGGKVWRRIWKRYKKPIRKILSSIIDGIIAFLIKIRRHLDGTNDNDDQLFLGVTGGAAIERSICIRYS